MTLIQTTRFGSVAVNDEHIIEFKDGMIGFPKLKKYFLVESPSMPLVVWLQSMDLPDVAFPLIEPWFFKNDYKVVMTDADKHSLRLTSKDRVKEFVVLTIPENMTQMTVNLKAPVCINIQPGLATQIIIQDKNLNVRTPAHDAFTRAMSSYLAQESTDQMHGIHNETIVDWYPVNVREEKDEGSAGAHT